MKQRYNESVIQKHSSATQEKEPRIMFCCKKKLVKNCTWHIKLYFQLEYNLNIQLPQAFRSKKDKK